MCPPTSPFLSLPLSLSTIQRSSMHMNSCSNSNVYFSCKESKRQKKTREVEESNSQPLGSWHSRLESQNILPLLFFWRFSSVSDSNVPFLLLAFFPEVIFLTEMLIFISFFFPSLHPKFYILPTSGSLPSIFEFMVTENWEFMRRFLSWIYISHCYLLPFNSMHVLNSIHVLSILRLNKTSASVSVVLQKTRPL